MNSWNILGKLLKEEEIVRYSNGWNTMSSKTQIKEIKEYHAKKREASKEEAPVSFPESQKWKNSQKQNRRKPHSPTYRITRIQKDSMENVFNMERTLMGFKDKEEQIMRQNTFTKK
ncbi:hypothetical protein O181_040962 [Austropuccinia psidii MF-1]|uniref:Uncharacterized protein n=1 Tax=Austropuccinia psidii MF-1 TaxID=1389203 RepID=A0A9Q3DFU4_9BASI|nr:hypothetical protein [Austropuccinia psidii MF-1]